MTHHKAPYETNYCIVSGHMNPVLDNSGFFSKLARVVENITGNKPRCETMEVFDHLVQKSEAWKLKAKSN